MDDKPDPIVIIIGGGLAGLSAAYDLGSNGFRVRLFESSTEYGGLANSIQLSGFPIERFYHFHCRSDHDLITLANDLTIRNELVWQHARTSFFHNDTLYPFGTPFNLIRFSPIPPIQRFRFGIHVINSRYRSMWKWLDQIPAKPWLIENIGEEAYNAIWKPLLQIKFGKHHEQISAAWIWHRIQRVASSRRNLFGPETFGYFKKGSSTLVDSLITKLKSMPSVSLQKDLEVNNISIKDNKVNAIEANGEIIPCDSVLSTIPLPKLNTLIQKTNYGILFEKDPISYIGVVCMLMSLKKPFSNVYWMNINDPRISFNGIIEYTNLNRGYQKMGLNILYIPFYLSTENPRYSYSDERLFDEYINSLTLINPLFNKSWVKEWRVYREQYAQAICTTNFAIKIPEIRSSVDGLYLTDSTQFYPEDRSLSAAIRQGRKAANLIKEDSE